ncbi:alpha/beta hydrolase [Streptomyces sp. NPDC050418]|uniref:alpha/beta hydrolase n=1 Tax=Streptomyces sp. NPDC050418 TaxID=3365612 RepID=UPI00378F1FF9
MVPEDMQCGRVTVPLDYATPDRGSLDLALGRLPATGPQRASLVLNPGGPGERGLGLLMDGAKEFSDLRKGYDVVSFDPRGVGRSHPVSCGSGAVADDVDSDADDTDSADGTDDAAAERLARVLDQRAEQCRKASGPLLDYMGTIHVARDMDVIRQALGDRKLNYLGFSYGTRLGATYAAQAPDRVGRMVLDGVDSLTVTRPERWMATARARQGALDDFLNWCVARGECGLGTNTRDARARMAALVTELNEKPFQGSDGAELSGEALVGVFSESLYRSSTWPSLAAALEPLAQQKDPGPFLDMLGAQGNGAALRRAPSEAAAAEADEIPADNSLTALTAVNCADDPDPFTVKNLADLQNLEPAFEQASPVFGDSLIAAVAMCYGKPRGSAFIRQIQDVDTPRMLLVGSRGDPATPYQWTEQTAARLGGQAAVLDFKGDGHVAYVQSKCAKQNVNEFLLYGSLPHSRMSCPAEDPGP